MSGRSVPYTYACHLCGSEDQGDNRAGPLRTKCRACMYGRVGPYRKRQTAAETNPFRTDEPRAAEERSCAGCGVVLPVADGAGRPRSFCAACRPRKTVRSFEAEARHKARRADWLAANTFALKPHLIRTTPPPTALAAARPKTTACICEGCGEVFWASKRARFCGLPCNHRAKGGVTLAEFRAAHQAASPRYQDHTCRQCGQTFRPKKIDRRQFCSRDCAFAGRRAVPAPSRDE